MPNEEWGIKRVCPTTGKRFYDLNKDPIVSPYTGETVTFDANNKTHVAVEKTKPAPEDVEDDEDDLLVDDDDDIDLDDDLLDDDEDDNVSLDEIADVAADDDD
ncbi:TIGR02300 family protein [Celeribacter sp.]|uniref:TIGR02300 family protein n=1 Tax=Celeribacter sp. TaxID=1890673 RepID=UPI003A924D48